MIDALRSEWVKLRTVPSNVVVVVIAVVISIAFAVLATLTVPLDQGDFDTVNTRFNLTQAGVGISRLLLAVVGALAIGLEFRHLTIRVTFAAIPARRRVLAAKAIVVGAVGLAVGIVTAVPSFVVGAAILGARDVDIALSDPGVARAVIGAAVLGALYALIGLGVGCILKPLPGTITLLILWPLLVEGIIGGFFASVGKYLPFTAGNALAAADGAEDTLSWWAGGLISAAFVVVLLVVGGTLLRARDA